MALAVSQDIHGRVTVTGITGTLQKRVNGGPWVDVSDPFGTGFAGSFVDTRPGFNWHFDQALTISTVEQTVTLANCHGFLILLGNGQGGQDYDLTIDSIPVPKTTYQTPMTSDLSAQGPVFSYGDKFASAGSHEITCIGNNNSIVLGFWITNIWGVTGDTIEYRDSTGDAFKQSIVWNIQKSAVIERKKERLLAWYGTVVNDFWIWWPGIHDPEEEEVEGYWHNSASFDGYLNAVSSFQLLSPDGRLVSAADQCYQVIQYHSNADWLPVTAYHDNKSVLSAGRYLSALYNAWVVFGDIKFLVAACKGVSAALNTWNKSNLSALGYHDSTCIWNNEFEYRSGTEGLATPDRVPFGEVNFTASGGIPGGYFSGYSTLYHAGTNHHAKLVGACALVAGTDQASLISAGYGNLYNNPALKELIRHNLDYAIGINQYNRIDAGTGALAYMAASQTEIDVNGCDRDYAVFEFTDLVVASIVCGYHRAADILRAAAWFNSLPITEPFYFYATIHNATNNPLKRIFTHLLAEGDISDEFVKQTMFGTAGWTMDDFDWSELGDLHLLVGFNTDYGLSDPIARTDGGVGSGDVGELAALNFIPLGLGSKMGLPEPTWIAGGWPPPPPPPTTNRPPGTYWLSTEVTLSAPEGATIYYTLNGGSTNTYSAPITISETTTLEFWYVLDTYTSPVQTAEYVIDQEVPASGVELTVETGQATTSGNANKTSAGAELTLEAGTAAGVSNSTAAATGVEPPLETGQSTTSGSASRISTGAELAIETGQAAAAADGLTPGWYLTDQQGRMYQLADSQGRFFALQPQ